MSSCRPPLPLFFPSDGLSCAAVPVIPPLHVGKKQKRLDNRPTFLSLRKKSRERKNETTPALTNATMYSVEDLLISHGYKLPKHATSSTPTPTPAPAPSSHQPRSTSPPSYSKHHEILENRSGPRTVNGYERGPVVAYGNGGGTRQPQAYDAGGCPNNNESRDRSLPRRDGENRCQTDTHSLGESLTSDSG